MARITRQFRNEINRVLGIEEPDSFRNLFLDHVIGTYDVLSQDIRHESLIARVSTGTGQVISPIVTNRQNFVPAPDQGQFSHEQVDWIRVVGVSVRIAAAAGNVGDLTATVTLQARWIAGIDTVGDTLFTDNVVVSPGNTAVLRFDRTKDLKVPIAVNLTSGTSARFEDVRISTTWPEAENATITHIVQYEIAIRRDSILGQRQNVK